MLAGNYFDPNLSNNLSSAALVALPGLPNTSAPDSTSGIAKVAAHQKLAGLQLFFLALIAGLGALGLAGIGRRANRSRFGRRRSRGRQRQSSGRLAVGMLAVFIVASVFDVARALALVSRAPHRAVRTRPATAAS